LAVSTVKLQRAESPMPSPPPAPTGAPVTPSARASARPARPTHGAEKDHKGSDPYSRGPARSPEAMTFNPYDRTPTRKR